MELNRPAGPAVKPVAGIRETDTQLRALSVELGLGAFPEGRESFTWLQTASIRTGRAPTSGQRSPLERLDEERPVILGSRFLRELAVFHRTVGRQPQSLQKETAVVRLDRKALVHAPVAGLIIV